MKNKNSSGLVIVNGFGFFNDKYKIFLEEGEVLWNQTVWIDSKKLTSFRIIIEI